MDLMTIGMLAVLAVLVFFMFRNNRKRKADAEKMQASLQPGVRIMTNFGLFGTLVSIDEAENIAVISVLSGAEIEVHRQTVARVIEPKAVEADAAPSTDAAAE